MFIHCMEQRWDKAEAVSMQEALVVFCGASVSSQELVSAQQLTLQSGFEMDVLSYLEMPASPNVTTSIPRINTASRHSSSSG
jgi:hypothetical protein